MSPELLLGLDAGTTSVKAVALTPAGRTVASATEPLATEHPREGWSQQDPRAIVRAARSVLKRLLSTSPVRQRSIAGLGITNQRESVLAVHREDGHPLSPVILWHDLRTLSLAEELGKGGWRRRLWRKGGMPLTNYPSAPKMVWLRENSPEVRRAARREEVQFVTVDAWLAHELCGAADRGAPFITDASNASRTLLLDIERGTYDRSALDHFGLDIDELPEIRPSWGCELGTVAVDTPRGRTLLPLYSILGDQQASLRGLSWLYGGSSKLTLGTGAFLLSRDRCRESPDRAGIIRTILWQGRGEAPTTGTEGSVGAAGSVLEWLCGAGLGIFRDSEEIERFAARSRGEPGIFVPALCGLFAPYWEMDARGLWSGIELGTRREELARSVIEGLAHTLADLIEAVEKASSGDLSPLLVDGGLSRSRGLMQRIADLSGVTLLRSKETEGTAVGAAIAAGIGSRFLPIERTGAEDVSSLVRFSPTGGASQRARDRDRWRRSLAQAFLLTKRQGGPDTLVHPVRARRHTSISV